MQNIATCHPHWNAGGLKLRSTDNVLFYVCERRMAQKSAVFRDMLTTLKPESSPSTKTKDGLSSPELNEPPIEMELSAENLEILLDHLCSLRPKLLDTNFHDSREIFMCCEKFDIVPSILVTFRQRLYETGKDCPWELLMLASERGDRSMAGAAFQHMTMATFLTGRDHHLGPPSFWESIGELREDWQLTIVRLAFGHPLNTGTKALAPYLQKSLERTAHLRAGSEAVDQGIIFLTAPWSTMGERFEFSEW